MDAMYLSSAFLTLRKQLCGTVYLTGWSNLVQWPQLYTPWNFHERTPGKFTFEGEADVERFLDIAQDLGLNVLLRVGPYICGEWDFGGFPWWLASSKVGISHSPVSSV